MSNLPSWKKWPKRISIKKVFSNTNLKLAKRRKIGIANAASSSSSDLCDVPKTTFLDGELQADTTKEQETNELKLNDQNLPSNGNIVRENAVNLTTFDSVKTNGDAIRANSSPVVVRHNGFLTETHQESKKSRKKFSINAVSKSLFEKDQKSDDASVLLTQKQTTPKLKYNLSRKNSSEQFTHLGLLTPAFILHPKIHNVNINT